MDWRSVNFDWNRARAFLVTAEEGSLSAAARALGTAQPTVGRQVDALERELGIALFERVGRGLTLTPGGLELLDHVRAMGQAAERVSLISFGQSQTIEGNICIAVSEIYAAILLPSILARLRALEPGISIEIVASSKPSDLRRREADIAIRNFRPTEPDLIAKKIKDIPARLYATQTYLEKIGNPVKLADLNYADFVSIDDTGALMSGLNNMGMSLTKHNFPIFCEDYNVSWAMVKQGLGIGILDGTIGDAEPKVVRVLPDLDPLMFPLWLVAHRDLTTSRRIRMVFDLLAAELGKTGSEK
ncbi:MAG: LysR family transcriptional regulator [Alphaproteobacteria bacterium]|nr:LysR family transcriptional regulator [Alphaproteobacteria bacterium]